MFHGITMRIGSLLSVLAFSTLVGCISDQAADGVVIDQTEDLDQHVGEVVVIQGLLKRGKVPSVLGLTLSYNDIPSNGLFGKQVQCRGKLVREVVRDPSPQAQRPDGVYYGLVNASKDDPVTVKAVE